MKAKAKASPKCLKQCRMCKGKGFPNRVVKTCLACNMTLGRWTQPFKSRCRQLWSRNNPQPFHQAIDESWPRWVKMKIVNMMIKLHGDKWAYQLYTMTTDSDSDWFRALPHCLWFDHPSMLGEWRVKIVHGVPTKTPGFLKMRMGFTFGLKYVGGVILYTHC